MDFELPHEIRGNRLSYAIPDPAIPFQGGRGSTRAIPFEQFYWRHCGYPIPDGLGELRRNLSCRSALSTAAQWISFRFRDLAHRSRVSVVARRREACALRGPVAGAEVRSFSKAEPKAGLDDVVNWDR